MDDLLQTLDELVDRVLRKRILSSLEYHIKHVAHSVFIEPEHVQSDPSFSLFITRGSLTFAKLSRKMAQWIGERTTHATREYLFSFGTDQVLKVDSNIATAIGCATLAYLRNQEEPHLQWAKRHVNQSVVDYAERIRLGTCSVDGTLAENTVARFIRERVYVAKPLKRRIDDYAAANHLDPLMVYIAVISDDSDKRLKLHPWQPSPDDPREDVHYII